MFFKNIFNLSNFNSIALLLISLHFNAQTPLYSNVQVNDNGSTSNRLGSASTTRNVGIDQNGNIYVVYLSPSDIRMSKSVDNGQSYLSSVAVGTSNLGNPEIAVSDNGHVFVSWVDAVNSQIFLSISTDGGLNFSSPKSLGEVAVGDITAHMVTQGKSIYLVTRSGSFVYFNSNNGLGDFKKIETEFNFVYTDIQVDKSGRVFVVADDPNLYMFQLDEENVALIPKSLTPPGQVYFSSYSLSDGPCGTFVFVAGGGVSNPASTGYKMDVNTGNSTTVAFALQSVGTEARVLYANAEGTLIDGYSNDKGELLINVSSNQGQSFGNPIVVAKGESHSIGRNPLTDDVVVVYQNNDAIYSSVYESSLKRIGLIEPSPKLSICNGANFNLDYILSSNFNTATDFKVILSDEFGSFVNGVEIGSVASNSNGSINCVLPNNLPPSDGYLLKMVSLFDCVESEFVNINIGVGASINALPALVLDDLYIACLDDDGVIINAFPEIETHISEVNYNFEWKLENETLLNETSSSIATKVSGIYEVIVADKISNCTVSRTTQVHIGEPPKISIELLSDDFEKNQTIHIIAEGIGDYEYSLGNGPYQDSSTFSGVGPGEHVVEARDKYGCGSDQSSVSILGYSSFFTPNNDGFNDYWNIDALKNQNATISIFNRHGELLKQINTSGSGWNGISNGGMMPNDDYWFKVEYRDLKTGVPKTFLSHFTLKR
ncbi:T9SS type B sorting domain-containing protein [Algibacter sp. 2305UL17-15]|uniref:T9SS type B sorting domain-containing protein n=1 Tax=Algibacter sp. 2305UL17-15 TaxID=3231268 RepID=UPI0034594EE9